MGKLSRNRRVVVEIREDLHLEIRKHAVLNDVKIYELANAIVEDFLKDEESIKRLIRKLRMGF